MPGWTNHRLPGRQGEWRQAKRHGTEQFMLWSLLNDQVHPQICVFASAVLPSF